MARVQAVNKDMWIPVCPTACKPPSSKSHTWPLPWLSGLQFRTSVHVAISKEATTIPASMRNVPPIELSEDPGLETNPLRPATMLRTEHYKTPVAIYELSRERAIRRGYWTGDPRDSVDEARRDPYYGVDGDINDNYPFAPPEVDQAINKEDKANVALNDEEDIKFVKELMGNFDFEAEDSNWGIEVYC
ncbi:hypothetical protein ARMGADRAFT_1038189 [Armillaria gallica]|uniref:Uncharacterized protein n=1 Tax=Armillaria gallica TaxID=47427 RepID=A0A2H3D3X9_ARMGA|nr:hypothetical protein ARMGADRAFT_1038189 [Armillaria gallica]